MKRGTTPTHVFNVNTDLTSAEEIYITYKQGSNVVVEFDLSKINVEKNKLTVQLTQKETLMFALSPQVRIQIRAKFPGGLAIASNIISTGAEEILKDGEI